jgi:hypothetical protein
MDSKISQLPSASKIYDSDLLIAVTGYNTAGAYPDNIKISLSQLRQDIIRLNEMIFLLSGFSGYYNSGNNTITITTHQKEGNLISLTYETEYPYLQIISTTGLNAIAGSNIDIEFANDTSYRSGTISTTGLNAVAGTGIYFRVDNQWPYRYEINTFDKIYEASGSYTIPTGTSSLDQNLLFPLIFPSSIESTSYSKWKCQGYYKNISMTTYIPATQPSVTAGPTGQPISWNSYSVNSIEQGYIIPSLFKYSYLLSNPNTKNYTVPLYDYSDNMLHTNHSTIGSKTKNIENVFLLAFFQIAENTSGYSQPSGGLGLLTESPWFVPPVATLYWIGTYNVDGTPTNTGITVPATGYITNLNVDGHRFLEIKAV